MRLTGQEVSIAFAQAALDSRPGESISFDRVAELLNQQLLTNLIGRPCDAGKPAENAAPAFPSAPGPGRCRICGCTDDRACLLERVDGLVGPPLTCAWASREPRTLCTNPECIAAANRAKAA
jgi:hypothetical protein